MTSSTGTDPHPEVSEISDYSEGLLPADRSAIVARHLAECAICADVLQSLEEIRGLLGTLPKAQRMPSDIAERIDAALAAEALLDSTRPDVPRETSSSASPSHPPLPGAVDVSRGTSTGPSGHAEAPSGPGGRARADGRGPGRRRRRGILAAASALGVLLVGGAVYAAASGGGTSNGASDSARQNVAGAAGTVGDQVRNLLAQAGGDRAGTAPVAPENTNRGNTPMMQPNGGGVGGTHPASPAQVPACVLRATHRTQPPLAAGRETFQGTQSYLVVLPHPNDESRVDAFIVNAACSRTSPGTVLFQGTYPR